MHKHFPCYYNLFIHFLRLFFFSQHFTMKNFKLTTMMKIFYRQCRMSPSRLGCYHLFSPWAFIKVPAYVSPFLSLGTQWWIKQRTCLQCSEHLVGGAASQPHILFVRVKPYMAWWGVWEKGRLRLTGVHGDAWTPFCWQVSFRSSLLK